MCGIAGFYNNKLNREDVIHAMNKRMEHRGPDSEGVWIDSDSEWTLGHRRLSILDLSESGSQPMVSHSNDTVICFNGEIYNIYCIEQKLLRDGLVVKSDFIGTSDTEILLEAIEHYGLDNALKLCKGMFAIAVYDRKKRVMSLARDRIGEKPLYYGFIKSRGVSFFAFASEMALFKEIPDVTLTIDKESLSNYFVFNYVPGTDTIYEEIKKMKPGTILELREPFDKYTERTYWSLMETEKFGDREIFLGSENEATEKLEELLKDAIRDQMVADVPVGAFLSGGVDSPLICALMQSLSEKPIKTFTIGFDDKKCSEACYAADIAKYLSTEHTELYLSEKEMADAVPKMPYIFSEPFGDTSQIATYYVSKLAREKVVVSLSGDAGDELFCGYESYWKGDNFWNNERRIPAVVRKMAAAVLAPFGRVSRTAFRVSNCLSAKNIYDIQDVVFHRKNWNAEHLVRDFEYKFRFDGDGIVGDLFKQMQVRDMLQFHTDDILVKVDRTGMAVSLENRIPMLDKDVVEFAFSLPTAYKYENGISKKILRNILYKYVPQKYFNRPKQGFAIPVYKWINEGETKEWAESCIYESHLVKDGYLNKSVVEVLWNQGRKTDKDIQIVWNILMAEEWYRSITKY